MKKTLLSLFAVISCFSYTQAQSAYAQEILIPDTTSIKQIGLSGGIKSFTEKSYSAIDNMGVIKRDKFLEDNNDFQFRYKYKTNKTYQYDIKGRLIKEISFGSPTYQKETITYIYNPQGKLSTINTLYNYSDGQRKSKAAFSYNALGLLSTRSNYSILGSLYGKIMYSYDSHKNIISIKEVDKDGDIESTESIKYKYADATPNVLYKEKEKTDYSGSETIRETYNEEGLLINKWTKYDFGVVDCYYQYNSAGYLTKVGFKECCFKSYLETYEYDDKNNLIKITCLYEDGTSKEQCYENGFIKEINDGKNTYTYEYKFDSKGNWISAIEYKNGIPTIIKERMIEYYN